MNTAMQLGYESHDRLLIVNADDYGLCKSANVGVLQLLEEGAISSTTIMMPCPWSEDASTALLARVPGADIGVHWTLTSEWAGYRWGPIGRRQRSDTLTVPGGWFPRTIADVERSADAEQLRDELIAQTEAALSAGLALTHADNHMGSLYGFATGRDLLTIVFDVCQAYGLPFRLPRKLREVEEKKLPDSLRNLFKLRVRQAEDRGIVLPDYVTGPEFRLTRGEGYEQVKAQGIAMLRGLLPGVTEWICHPAPATEELRSFHGQPDKRAMELAFWRDPDVIRTLIDENIRMIGWRELQQLQRMLTI